MKILGISISNFRSIGKDPIVILPLKKINVLIGQNNAGKSNIIKALQKIKSYKGAGIGIESLDFHNRDNKLPFKFRFYIKSEKPHGDFGISDSSSSEGNFFFTYEVHDNNVSAVDSFFRLLSFAEQEKAVKFKLKEYSNMELSEQELKGLMLKVATSYLGDILNIFPELHVIPQFRQILPGQDYTLDGKNLIATLGEFQHPPLGSEEKKDKFLKIQELMRQLLHLPEAKLEVPHTNDKILIENQGLRLPLESYGTGVHELLILATALFAFDNVIFCIEEPEIHLHPKLQREFLEFIKLETNNKYILTSHSNAFLSINEDIQVVHLWQKNNVTFGQSTETSLDALKILDDLGIKPSDILQANFVIWVEGPSDRIYLNRWISLLDKDLKENIDYVIMFYGGKLLSHVSMERELSPTEPLVQLLRLNQHSAIIIDSDRNKPRSRINDTKKRIREECDKNNVFCWITHGREIENYLPGRAISSVYSELCGLMKQVSFNRFDKLEDVVKKEFRTKWRSSYEKSKPDFARKIAPLINIDDINNNKQLKSTLSSLIKIINNFNITS